jgi:hypothetical protein
MPGREIVRTKQIEGVVTPGVICNGGHYFFVNLQVYEDGLVNCWELLDLPLFKGKLSSGWVVPAIPDREEISIHHLGAWRIEEGRWDHTTPDTFYDHVVSLVRELNPDMVNLYDCRGQTTKLVGKVRVMESPREAPSRWKNPESYLPRRVTGESMSVFVRRGAEVFLANLRVFADKTVEIGRLPDTPLIMNVDDLGPAIREGILLAELAPGTRVHIHGLGQFVAAEESYHIAIDEIAKDIADHVEALNDRPTSGDRCKAAYDAFVADPSVATRDALREAYESTPEHTRQYVLRDMDLKDHPIRMIIYGEHEIEHWSHRIVARSLGDSPLPSIEVPKIPGAGDDDPTESGL